MSSMLSGTLLSARKNIRILSAKIELLEHRVDHLESVVQETSFPAPLTLERLESLVGTVLNIHICGQTVQGTLLSVQLDYLELKDSEGRQVLVPFHKIKAIDLV